ncbi:inorganic phosphate transporter [Nocardioides sp. YIM 152315]|uniref:inorganic phosphate transporter n=1 Tax=Nocardioides sp. YIM 152315 TaxID=3031760 RepID=UPI0023DAE76A|nr:inorganic phosphate transporter [Nocardioides sp. YIM 152315]MDF1602623.1 inorganic phosphate transporter [Nocardioides sp. YIM 152315]
MSITLLAAACVLSVVYGTNAGGTIVAAGLTVRAFAPLVGVVVLGIAVGVAPVVFGTAVASTVVGDLIGTSGSAGQVALLDAVVAALVTSSVLSWAGIPSSLTLALIGALAGAGLGAGVPVSWLHLAIVLLFVACAPVAGAVVAHALRRRFERWRTPSAARVYVTRLHVASFLVLTFAFGANDAQKLLAVLYVATGDVGHFGVGESVRAAWWQLAVVATLFAVGAAVGVRRMAGAVNKGVINAQPLDAVVTELSTASVMFTSSLFGSPVGMSQTLSGSLVGVGLSKGRGRVRWGFAGRSLNAWVATMPSAFGLAWLLGVLTTL